MDIIYPLSKKGVKTSGFGYRNITGNRTHHNGIDIGVPDGTPVLSVADGEVVRSDMSDYGGYGNFIIIDHDGYFSAYAHLTDRQVNVGDKVKQGEQIALSGGGQGKANGAGSSTGPHLHFEIRKSKNARDKSEFEDPEPYLSGKSPSGIKVDDEKPKKTKLRKKLTFSGYGGQAANNIRLLIKKMKSKGIKDPVAQLGILATIGKESGFIPQNEIGYCGTPDSSIISIFGSRGKKCKSLKCDDEEFFDCVYGKDSGADLGNTKPGDGYKYRGRGFNQITGRYNYKQRGYESNPEELNNVDGAADAAIKFLVKDNPSSLNNKFDSIDDSIRHFVKINAGGSPSGGSFSKAKNVADKFKIVDSKESDDYESDVDSDVEDEVDNISSEDKAKKGLELLKKFIEIGKIGKESLKEEVDRMKDLMKKIV
jgi:predicted chitinase